MHATNIGDYYEYLNRHITYFDIELIYNHIQALKGTYKKVKYVEDKINDYISEVNNCIEDKQAHTEYYATIEYILNLNHGDRMDLQYRFSKYQLSIYLLLLKWRKDLDSKKSLKAPDYIIESEFYRSYGNPIPLFTPKSLFLVGIDPQKYIDLIPSTFVNKQKEFVGTVSKTIIVAWYEALKEHGSIVQTQLTSHEVANLVNELFLNLDISYRPFLGSRVTKVYEHYKPFFVRKLEEM